MSHAHGAYLGSVRCIDTLRGRCVLADDGSDCWHLRSPRGRPLRAGAPQPLWVHGIGKVTALQGAWYVARGELVRARCAHIVWRTCTSRDCVNPAHLSAGPKAAFGAMLRTQQRLRTPMAAMQRARSNAHRTGNKLTAELAAWARESTQPAKDAAHGLGIAASGVCAIRRGESWAGVVGGASAFTASRANWG